jgi:predicted small lipoprotein YifL
MRIGHDRTEARAGSSGLRVAGAFAVAALLLGVAACGQETPPADSPAEADAAGTAELVQVEGLEQVTTEYIVANPTNVFNNHFVYDTEVVGEVERGETVEVIGKVPGYEWLLIARDGEPLGYVPISMLSPADLYVP